MYSKHFELTCSRAKIKPINIIIHHRAANIWNKLEAGIAGDLESYREIIEIEMHKYLLHFRFSYLLAQKPEPPPIYRYKTSDRLKRALKRHYYQNV